MLDIDLMQEYGKVKYYFLGGGVLDGMPLEDHYLGWALIETPDEKFFIKCHIADGNKFVIGFERYNWKKWATRFELETLDGHDLSGVSVTNIMSQTESVRLLMGEYKYTDGISTIPIVILGEELPKQKERNQIAKAWKSILELIRNNR